MTNEQKKSAKTAVRRSTAKLKAEREQELPSNRKSRAAAAEKAAAPKKPAKKTSKPRSARVAAAPKVVVDTRSVEEKRIDQAIADIESDDVDHKRRAAGAYQGHEPQKDVTDTEAAIPKWMIVAGVALILLLSHVAVYMWGLIDGING